MINIRTKNSVTGGLIGICLMMVMYAQPYTQHQLSLEEGLSQSTVFSMAQDSAGFCWFGTQDGLNRYDGYQFEVFKHEPFDSTSLADNQVSALACDTKNRLWVGFGFHGLDVFIPETNTFRHFTKTNNGLSSDLITCLRAGKDGHIWVGTSFGLNLRPYWWFGTSSLY